MYTRRSGLIIGFHGCDKSVQQSVLKNPPKDLLSSNNPWDWLGHGIYFWENSPERALHFAEEQSKRQDSKIKNPAVIGAVIDLGYCLDLMDMANIVVVKKTYEAIKDSFKLLGKELPENKSPKDYLHKNDLLFRNLDCLVINSLHATQDQVRPFDSVKGIFTEGGELYLNAGFREKDHVQICIRNTNCIKGYFLPRKRRSSTKFIY
ncbi:MAG: hypothetical protein IPM74_02550 [Crocinitomicaceae bacterium]|nr:hypothetical protein [Crocinitomicaceae bacterium]MBK8924795.1 hypothetical protein [Crocinitomicaceae bacterium]